MGFFDGGSKSLTFETPGETVTGTILGMREQQARKYQSDDLDFWPDGQPIMQMVVDLKTDLRSDDPDDDGERSLYVRQSSRLYKAVREALKAAKASDIAVGGKLTVTFTGYEEGKNPRNPPKGYKAAYQGPSSMLADQPPAPAAPAPAPAPAAQPTQPAPASEPAAPAADADSGKTVIEQAKELLAAGLPDADVASALSLPPQAVAAIKNTLAPAS